MKFSRTLTAFLLLIAVCASAGEAIFTASVSKNNIRIGEQVVYRLVLESDEELLYEWPVIKDTLGIKNIEILSSSQVREEKKSSSFIRQQEFVITCFDCGNYIIPSAKLVVNGDTLFSNTLSLQVNTVEVDTTKAIKDIKEIYGEEYTWSDYIRDLWDWIKENWYYVTAGIAAAAFALFLLLRKKKKESVADKIPELPADVMAIQKLEELAAKKLWQEGHVKSYYVELSEIIREYIEKRFFVQAMEQTTDELLHNLRFAEIIPEARQELVMLLKVSDLVKFAKEKPVSFENEGVLEKAKKFVLLTRISDKKTKPKE